MFANLYNRVEGLLLVPLRDERSLDLIFDKVNRGFFLRSDHDTAKNQQAYRETLMKMARFRLGCSIMLGGKEIGFIICGGKNNSLIGGLLPAYQNKSYYGYARNGFIRYLNSLGIYDVTYSVDKSNNRMLKFVSKTPHTHLIDDKYIAHYDPDYPAVSVALNVKPGPNLKSAKHDLYHISFNPNLDILEPRLPAGDSDGGEFSEPNIPRVSLGCSPELCFRSIYPNIKHLLEGVNEDKITFTLYKADRFDLRKLRTPSELVENNWVHDAHVTLEHFVEGDVKLKKLSKVTFKNTSPGPKLKYQPFLSGEVRDHSPKSIIIS